MSRKRRQQRATVVTAPAPAPTRGLNVATFASYDGAMPDKTRQLSNRIGTNPNSAYAQQQRVTMMWQAEDLVKNSDWVSFIYSLKQYCQPTGYHAETGDPALDNEVNAYLREAFKRGGINCSAMEAFSAAAHVEMPVRGDSILEWYQDESQMRLIVQCADQIGELYRFINPSSYGEGINDPPFFTSAEYIAGVYLSPFGLHEGYKIYERGYNQTYLNPRNVPAGQCIYFQDNLFVGVRGVTKFAAAIQSIQKRNKTWQSGMDSMALQAKIAAIGRNNSGGEFTYEQTTNDDGSITYQERMESGAVVKWQFPGDEYQFLKNEQPGPALLQGLDYADERTCLSLGFPKSFLISARDGGGAPSRFDANRAGREIMRLRDTVYVPRLDKIAYGFIMDGIRRGRLPAKSGILRGRWHFPPLPSADAFRDDKSDIMAIRAGLTTATAVIAKNGEGTFESVLQRREQEAVAIRVAAWRATQTLKQMGIPGEITADEIAQKTDNPSFESAIPEVEPTQPPDASQI